MRESMPNTAGRYVDRGPWQLGTMDVHDLSRYDIGASTPRRPLTAAERDWLKSFD